MPSFPSLNLLGRLCGSGRSKVVQSSKNKSHPGAVKRMSIIEDGEISEVLYLVPKRSMLRQMPYLNPADYYLCEGSLQDFVAHPQDPSHAAEKPVIQCHKCGDPCKGEVLRVQAKHFHIKCFTCKVCGCDLAQGGFFIKNGDYLCTLDYQRMYGTRCNGCGEFVEGEVVTALGKTYHPNCFACTVCKHPFPPGDRVTFNGRDCLCQNCAVQPMSPGPKELTASGCCAGCGRDIKNGQALLALEKQWHLGCFKCKACGKVLSGEYISKDGAPYCEKDYQVLFGVKCEACHQFITGKVLEAGDKHYHPSCARCSRCNQMFTEGEEMYLQGSTVWHPDCKLTTKAEEKLRPTRTSCESIYSRPGSSIPGSPGHTIYAKVDNEILDYKDLAAIPKVKAIYDIERPDLITYEPFYSTTLEDRQERQSVGEIQSPRSDRSSTHNDRAQRFKFDFSPVHDETSPRTLSPTPSAEQVEYLYCDLSVPFQGYPDIRDRVLHRSTSQGSIGSPGYSRHNYTPTVSRSPQHFHRPDQGVNIYRKPPIYKQHAGSDTRRRSSSREEEDEELQKRRQLQEEQLMKLNSGLGQLILKEEMEKETRERPPLPASRYDSPLHSSPQASASKTSSLPGYGRNGLHRGVSTDFAQYNSYGDVSGVRGKCTAGRRYNNACQYLGVNALLNPDTELEGLQPSERRIFNWQGFGARCIKNPLCDSLIAIFKKSLFQSRKMVCIIFAIR
ncbi:actin-binding LIM protein 1 isoform X21 [Pleurodeles waltl]|uniref:actin-binding LIM protein 1 isoform X21 n=1 Tax=Pleurodeles waltl TaxID=8319 RepID=UPI003709BCC1